MQFQKLCLGAREQRRIVSAGNEVKNIKKFIKICKKNKTIKKINNFVFFFLSDMILPVEVMEKRLS